MQVEMEGVGVEWGGRWKGKGVALRGWGGGGGEQKLQPCVYRLTCVCQGGTYPAMHALWAVWAPVEERSVLSLFTWSGEATHSFTPSKYLGFCS